MTTLQLTKTIESIEVGLVNKIQKRTNEFGNFKMPVVATDTIGKYHSLSSLFVWKDTPEGHRYWSNINIKIMELL